MHAYISVDVGTTNWKVAAFDCHSSLLTIRKRPAVTHSSADGIYYDADEIWDNFSSMIKEVQADLADYEVKSIACTGMAESFVLLDSDDKALNKVPAWFDNRNYNVIGEIRNCFTDEEIYSKTGLDIHPVFVLEKLLSLKHNIPSILQKAKHLLQMPEFITYKLCGEVFTDYSLASRTSMFNIFTNCWDNDLLGFSGISEDLLPVVVSAGTSIGSVTETSAAQTGLSRNVIVSVGGHDHPCASIAGNSSFGGELLDSSGTAESFLYISDKDAPPPSKWYGLRVCRYLTPDKYVLWGGIPASGKSIEWAMNQFYKTIDISNKYPSLASYDEFCNDYLCDVPIGSNSLFFIPYLRGAGAPYWNGAVNGGYLGLSDRHTAKDMLKAAFEGIAYNSRVICETVEKASGNKVAAFNTVGGGARSKYMQQIKANLNGFPVRLYNNSEATLAGCALLGAIAVGDFSCIDEITKVCSSISDTVVPDPEACKAYEEFYKVFLKIYDSVSPLLTEIFSLAH